MSYLNLAAQNFLGLSFSSQAELPSKWTGWPFHTGYGGDWETSLATFAFSALILGIICLFLRLLYGPRGIWRDKEMDREAAEARRKAHAELDAAYRAGRIDEARYKLEKRAIDR
ncbi:MAG: SHOCT domain-containing protein [Humidesulfovibrio sp.]|nr:SHOCT domain-containing protein [Humidesulfovibrio sp.]